MKSKTYLKSLRKYVFYEFTNPQTGKVVSDNMNYWEWERLQMDRNRAKCFRLIRVLDLDNPTEAKEAEPLAAPILQDDPLECPLCGFIGKNAQSLQMHKRRKHA